jgi:methionyl-tRNA formyltransferase
MAGDPETGVSIIELIEELDAGPILAQHGFPIDAEDDAGAVYARAAPLAVELLGDLHEPRPQPSDGVTYAEKIVAADRQVDLARPEEAVRRIRALSPHIGARAEVDGRPLTIWQARVEGGRLVPVEVQPEGGRRMSYAEFQRGLR